MEIPVTFPYDTDTPSSSQDLSPGEKPKEFLPVSKKLFVKLNNACITKAISHTLIIYEDTDLSQTQKRLNECSLEGLLKETENLKKLGIMNVLSVEKLLRLLKILWVNTRDNEEVVFFQRRDSGLSIPPIKRPSFRKIMLRAYSSLVTLNILTAPNMPKRVYSEEFVDEIITFFTFQLQNIIIPLHIMKSKTKKHRPQHEGELSDKEMVALILKMSQIMKALAVLLEMETFDTILSKKIISSIISSDLFNEINFLQESCIKLSGSIFKNYKALREWILDKVLMCIERFSRKKTFKLRSGEFVHMPTVMILQWIQSLVSPRTENKNPQNLTQTNQFKINSKITSTNKSKPKNIENICCKNYEEAVGELKLFIKLFLNKCQSSINEDENLCVVLENFIDDVLLLCNKPEWPIAENCLKTLQHFFLNFISENNSKYKNFFLASTLDFTTKIALKLLKDRSNLEAAENVINKITTEDLNAELKNASKLQICQYLVLEFLTREESAKYFYFSQCYSCCKKCRNQVKDDLHRIECLDKEDEKPKRKKLPSKRSSKSEVMLNPHKQLLVRGLEHTLLNFNHDYEIVLWIKQYLFIKNSMGVFEECIETLLEALSDVSVPLRTKSLKRLSTLIQANLSLMQRVDVKTQLEELLDDISTAVREATLDVIGKFVITSDSILDHYYDIIVAKIFDSGFAVRKRAVRILSEICLRNPEFGKVPEICFKILCRVKDEEGIKKLVVEVFQNLWFSKSKTDDLNKAKNILSVVNFGKEVALDCFENVLNCLYDTKQNQEEFLSCSRNIIYAIMLYLHVDNNQNAQVSKAEMTGFWSILLIFAKTDPQFLVGYVKDIQPFLKSTFNSPDLIHVVNMAFQILDLTVPILENPKNSLLNTLEECSILLAFKSTRSVVFNALRFLSSIANKFTKNYKLVRDMFSVDYNNFIVKFRYVIDHPDEEESVAFMADPELNLSLARAFLTTGYVLRFYDFKNIEVSGELTIELPRKLFGMLLDIYPKLDDSMAQVCLFTALSSICIRHNEFFLNERLTSLYRNILTRNDVKSVGLKWEILNGFVEYLVEDERKVMEGEREWKQRAKFESLKEMDGEVSGISSTIIQRYLKEILVAYLNHDLSVRRIAAKLINIVLLQGLTSPLHAIPYLISMTTDPDKIIVSCVKKLLLEIEVKYHGLVHSKSSAGLKLSFELQKITKAEKPTKCQAVNEFLYDMHKNATQQRRGLVLNILKNFEEKTEADFDYMVYLAENLAHFPYTMLDEVLYIAYQINTVLLVTGTNILQDIIKEFTVSDREENSKQLNLVEDLREENVTPSKKKNIEELVDNEETLLVKLPEDTTKIKKSLETAKGCVLLFQLKQYFQRTYVGITDVILEQYSPYAKVNVEKKLVAKRSDRFVPKQIFGQKITQNNEESDGRLSLVREFLEFQKFTKKIVSDDSDSEEFCMKEYLDATKSGNKSVSKDNTPKVEKKIFNFRKTPVASKGSKRKKTPVKKLQGKKRIKLQFDFSSEDESSLNNSDSDPDFVI